MAVPRPRQRPARFRSLGLAIAALALTTTGEMGFYKMTPHGQCLPRKVGAR